jgi:CheY-like chemotaxis protein
VARIMIVDDERDVVTLLKFLLEKDGHEVLTANNGAEALKTLGIEPSGPAVPLDLLISDVLMPVMDGYTLCLRLREDAKGRAIPVIVLTAKGDTRNVFQVLPNVGATIDKPFDPKKLRELIASMVQAQAR